MKRIAVYGTLRKGGGLHDWVQGAEPLGTDQVQGFDMYDISGWYPAITKGENTILVEVYELDDEVADRISRMEEDANYTLVEVDTKFGQATMYHMDKKYLSERTPLVESGNWIEYFREKEPNYT